MRLKAWRLFYLEFVCVCLDSLSSAPTMQKVSIICLENAVLLGISLCDRRKVSLFNSQLANTLISYIANYLAKFSQLNKSIPL